MAPTKIMMIRHGEKPSKDGNPPFGIDEAGNRDEHSLIVRGWVRSGALVNYFSSPHGSVGPPDRLYGAAYDPQAGSPHGKRAYQTLVALAAAVGRTIDTSFSVGDETLLCAALRDEPGTVLVSWEHHNIPLIVKGMTDDPAFAEIWPDRFDLVWVLDATSTGYDFAVENQGLLADDLRPTV